MVFVEEDGVRRLEPDQDGEPTAVGRASQLRHEIRRYRRRLAEIDHPETVRIFELLMGDAQAKLNELENRATSTARRTLTS